MFARSAGNVRLFPGTLLLVSKIVVYDHNDIYRLTRFLAKGGKYSESSSYTAVLIEEARIEQVTIEKLHGAQLPGVVEAVQSAT